LTGQKPTKQTYTDWIATAEVWHEEELTLDSLKLAWNESKSDHGFHVGRPGALTVVARSMMSKAQGATAIEIDIEEIQRTRHDFEGKWSHKFVPRPADVQRPRNLKPRFKKGQDPT
jgi:hypothetical protein